MRLSLTPYITLQLVIVLITNVVGARMIFISSRILMSCSLTGVCFISEVNYNSFLGKEM